jgi:hypothetical protein
MQARYGKDIGTEVRRQHPDFRIWICPGLSHQDDQIEPKRRKEFDLAGGFISIKLLTPDA